MLPAPARPEPSAEQLSLDDFWNHVFRGDRVSKAPLAPPPQPTSAVVAEAPKNGTSDQRQQEGQD